MKCTECGKTANLAREHHISGSNEVACYAVFVCRRHKLDYVFTERLACSPQCYRKANK